MSAFYMDWKLDNWHHL